MCVNEHLKVKNAERHRIFSPFNSFPRPVCLPTHNDAGDSLAGLEVELLKTQTKNKKGQKPKNKKGHKQKIKRNTNQKKKSVLSE